MEDDFLKTLQQNSVKHRDEQALQVLDRFCQSIRDYTYQKVECWREPGFATNFGQEWRVTIKPAARAYQQILFRAYVPLSGYPARIDLYAGEMTECANEAALRRVLNAFLKQKTVQDTIEYLRSSASVGVAG